jgi:2-phosphosulfolactate phosphatase
MLLDGGQRRKNHPGRHKGGGIPFQAAQSRLSFDRGAARQNSGRFRLWQFACPDNEWTFRQNIIHTPFRHKGAENASGADEIITGSLLNAKAVARYIRTRSPKKVSLVCMGWEGLQDTDEDIICAQYIESLLRGKESEISARIEALKQTDGARFFDQTQQDSCPQEDFYLCTACNIFDFVLKLDENGTMQRIDC